MIAPTGRGASFLEARRGRAGDFGRGAAMAVVDLERPRTARMGPELRPDGPKAAGRGSGNAYGNSSGTRKGASTAAALRSVTEK
jgi:hypothetical protein